MIRFFVGKKNLKPLTTIYKAHTYMILLDLLIGHENTIFRKKDFFSKHFYLKSNPPKRWKWKMYNTHVWIFKNDRVLDDGASVDVWIPKYFSQTDFFHMTWSDIKCGV